MTSGKGINKVSELNAFDLALFRPASANRTWSLCRRCFQPEFDRSTASAFPGARSRMPCSPGWAGAKGRSSSAGISYAFRTDGQGGYVAEGHLNGTQKALKEFLKWRMEEIAHFRGVELKRIHYRTEELSIPMDHYGVCIAACVFLP